MNRIRELRKQKKMTQKELAIHLEIANSTLSYWEQGKYEPDIKSLKMLSGFFNVPIDYLLYSDKPEVMELNRQDNSTVGEKEITYDPDRNNPILNRSEFDGLTEVEIEKLAEYAEFIKSQRHKT